MFFIKGALRPGSKVAWALNPWLTDSQLDALTTRPLQLFEKLNR